MRLFSPSLPSSVFYEFSFSRWFAGEMDPTWSLLGQQDEAEAKDSWRILGTTCIADLLCLENLPHRIILLKPSGLCCTAWFLPCGCSLFVLHGSTASITLQWHPPSMPHTQEQQPRNTYHLPGLVLVNSLYMSSYHHKYLRKWGLLGSPILQMRKLRLKEFK